LWPIIIILMNLPDTQRYDPRNIIIMYVATSIDGGQPKNFNAHLKIAVQELLAGAAGFKLHVGDTPTTVHVVTPIISCDGPGARLAMVCVYDLVFAALFFEPTVVLRSVCVSCRVLGCVLCC